VSTITTIPRPPVAPSMTPSVPAEERGVMRGVSWNLYDRLTDAIGERSSIRVAFDGKDVEIVVLGPIHENLGDLLSLLVNEVYDGLEIDCQGLRSTTWKRPEVDRGVESDLCYYFDPAKLEVCEAAVARNSNNGADYPIPDLVIEIDLSPSKIDRPGIYSKLRTPEVWRFSDDTVSIEQLAADGNYVAAESSRFLYVRADEVTRWLIEGKFAKRRAWKRRIQDWVRAELRPRAGI
jgi:Uma2 family endonuclease